MASCCYIRRTLLRSPQVKSILKLNDISSTHQTLWSRSCCNFVLNKSKVPVLQRSFHHEKIFSGFTRHLTSRASHDVKDSVQIYYGSLTSQIRTVKIFSLMTSATGIAAQPLLIQKASEMNSLGLGIAIGSFFGFFTFVTPFLLHWMAKNYVTTLEYNPETGEYTATTLTLLLGRKKTTFKVDDVLVPEISGMFSTFNIKNGPSLFVDPRHFSHPEHYVRLMGYDKPIDFKLETLESEKPNTKS